MTGLGTEQRTASTPRRTTIVGSVAGSGLGAALVLALLAGAGAFAATVVPRENAQAQSSALRTELASAPGTSSLFGSSDLGSLAQSLHPAAPDSLVSINQLAEPEKSLRTELASLGVPLSSDRADYWQGLNTIQYNIRFPNPTPAQNALQQVQVNTALNFRTHLTDHAVLVRGALPDQATSPAGADRPGVFQVAVSERTATTFHLGVGTTMTLAAAAATPIRLRVTGILKARDPADEFWGSDALTIAPQFIVPENAPAYWQSDFFVGQGEVNALEATFSGKAMPLVYNLPLDLSQLTSAQAQPLADAIVTATADAANLPLPGGGGPGAPTPLAVGVAAGASQALAQFLSERQAVDAVLSVVVGSLAALGAAVLLLCILLLAERRSAEFTLLRARGASGRQLALLATRASAISVVPAAAGVLLGCVLVRSPLPILADWWVPALIALIALAGPGVAAAIRYRARATRSTDRWSAAAVGVRTPRAGVRRDRIRRAVGSAAAVVLCVGAVAVLRHYGSGSNLLAALAPFLIAVPIAIGIYYLTPPVVRALTRAAARRRDAVPFIAMARASRGSTIAWLPSLALVLTLAVVAVGSMVHDTVVSGEVDGSWASVGADDVITALGAPSIGFDPAAVHALTTLPGVARSATAGVLDPGEFVLTSASSDLPTNTVVVVVDAARYRALTEGTPAAQLPAGLAEPADAHTPVPIVASATVAVDLAPGGSMVINQVKFPIKRVGIATATAAVPGADDFVILPSWAFDRYHVPSAPPPSLVLLNGGVNATTLTATLHRVAAGASLTQRTSELSALTHAPFQADTFDTLDLSILGAALLAVVALLAGLTIGARSRDQALARLATMGLSRRQANRLVLLENLPALAAALIGGVVCTLAIGALIGPGIDLGVFTGTAQAVPLRVDPWILTLAGAAIALTAAVTLAGHTAVAHRRGVTAALRLGNGE
jgi:putative ABC transport system permease protein